MIYGIIIGAFITGVIIALLYFFLFKKRIEIDSKEAFENVASKVFEEKIKGFLDISSKVLGDKKQEIDDQLKEKETRFTDLIEVVKKEIKSHHEHVNKLEEERIRTFTELQKDMGKHGEIASELQSTTTKLIQTLSNSRTRGQLGEKVAEDILKASGLIEGMHYLKNKKQETHSTRPDFAFLLPDKFKINMDVKFPFDNYAKMIEAESLDEKENSDKHKKQFHRDLKDKITEVTTREYINPKENTLEYVILFIPNEGVSSFIHEHFPDIFDLAIEKRVMMTSPYQLFGFVSIIRQAFQNFYYEEKTKTILSLISEFSKRYDIFKGRFTDMKSRIEKVDDMYEDIAIKSFKMIDSTVKKIDKYKQGLPVEEIEAIDADTKLLRNNEETEEI